MTTGKQFEKVFKAQMSKVANVYVHRIVDQLSFKKGSYNIADFIVYRYPTMYFMELKTTEATSLPRKNIAETQLLGMYSAVKTKGVKAYIVCWFYKKDTCRAFPIEYVWKQFNLHGKKSLRFDDEHGILISGKKKKKFWDWNWTDMFSKK